MANEDVSIRIVADGATLNRELRKVEQTVDRTKNRVGSDLRRMDTMFARRFANMGRAVDRTARRLRALGRRGALFGAAAAGGMLLLIERSISAADAIAKTAKSASISAEALQEYRFAARRAGVETAQLDKAMLFLIKSVAELQTRVSSELTTALQDFNPELLETLRNTKSQEEAFRTIAEAIRTANTDLERAAIARAAFGRGGIQMVNMLRDGTKGLDEMAAKARELGLVMTNDTAAGAEEAADALGDLSDVISQRVVIAVAQNADTIRDMAIQITEAIPEIISMAAAFLRWANIIETPDTIRLVEVRDRIREIDEALQSSTFRRMLEFDIFGREGPLAKERASLVEEMAQLEADIEAQQNAARDRQRIRDEQTERDRQASAAAAAASREKTQAVAEGKELERREQAAKGFLDRINSAFLAATDQQIALIEKRRDADLAALDEVQASAEDKAKARVEITKRSEIEIAAVRKKGAEDQKKAAEEAQREMEERAQEATETLKEFGREAGQSFRNVIKGTESVADAFEKMSERILDALFDMALNDLLSGTNKTGDLFGTLFGAIGGAFGGGSPAFTGGATNQLSTFNTGGVFDIGSPFHRGGIVGKDGGAPRPVIVANQNVPRLHRGGVIGLRSNETLGILENEEEVLTRRDPRHRRNAGGGGITIVQNFPNAKNERDVRMSGSEASAKTGAAAQRGMMRKGIA